VTHLWNVPGSNCIGPSAPAGFEPLCTPGMSDWPLSDSTVPMAACTIQGRPMQLAAAAFLVQGQHGRGDAGRCRPACPPSPPKSETADATTAMPYAAIRRAAERTATTIAFTDRQRGRGRPPRAHRANQQENGAAKRIRTTPQKGRTWSAIRSEPDHNDETGTVAPPTRPLWLPSRIKSRQQWRRGTRPEDTASRRPQREPAFRP
jgi:hypothetical protein